MSIITACATVERCPCINFPTAIIAWLKEHLDNSRKNASTVNALCVLGISLPHFRYQECKLELNIHTLPEPRAWSSLFPGFCLPSPQWRCVHTEQLSDPTTDIVSSREDGGAGLDSRALVISFHSCKDWWWASVSKDWDWKLKVRGRDAIVSATPRHPPQLLRRLSRRSNSFSVWSYLGAWYSDSGLNKH